MMHVVKVQVTLTKGIPLDEEPGFSTWLSEWRAPRSTKRQIERQICLSVHAAAG